MLKTPARYGTLEVHPIGAYDPTISPEVVPLSPTESYVLLVLVLHQGELVPCQVILDEVWSDFDGDEHLVRKYIQYLREKLANHAWIVNQRGKGYRIVPKGGGDALASD